MLRKGSGTLCEQLLIVQAYQVSRLAWPGSCDTGSRCLMCSLLAFLLAAPTRQRAPLHTIPVAAA